MTLKHAQEWHDEWCRNDCVGETDSDQLFGCKWNKVRSFRTFNPIGERYWKRCPQAILTHWWYVGEANQYAWECYLLLLKWTKMIINFKTTDSVLNMAASNLQSPLLEPQFYSDTCLVKRFHDSYFRTHMAALMKGDDLTGIVGFQSHCMASRYYKMAANLTLAKESTTDYNSFFTEFIDSLQLIGDKGPLLDDIAQAEKAKLFLNAAIKSLHKHFGRWCSVQLLPASLLAEQPLAACVARVILDKPPPVYIKPPKDSSYDLIAAYDKLTIFRSSAHKHTPFFLPSFEAFIQDRLDAWRDETGDTSAFNDSIKSAANSIIVNSIDFRDVNAVDPTPIQLHMWRTYLPLPHQTQSVERGVKESGLVAATGRGEEARSCWATVRDDLVLRAGIDRKTTNEARIKLPFQGVVGHVTKYQAGAVEVGATRL